MNGVSHFSISPWRLRIVLLGFILVGLGLVWRLLDLMVVDRDFLQQQGRARSIRTIKIPAYRGMIVDRNGAPLAVSSPVYSVWVDPEIFMPTPSQLKKLAPLLKLPMQQIKQTLQKSAEKSFLYLKRGIVPHIAKKIQTMGVKGLYLRREFRRFYPEGEVTAHVIGFNNIDDKGQEGLELAYDSWLKGVPGKERVLKDRLGRVIAVLHQIKPAKAGHELRLSIDKRLQYLAYWALKKGVMINKAKSGSVVMLDVQTGEVLAMANLPSFNPNHRPTFKDGRYRNRAVTDIFEPGSVIKPFSLAFVLSSKKYTPKSVINTAPGWLNVDGNLVEDEHNYGKLTLTEILQHSSNVGVSKLILSLPKKGLWKTLHHIGFGEISKIGFPGEQPGRLVPFYEGRDFVAATLAWGYGIAVTPLQLARAYGVFANGGVLKPVSLLRLKKIPEGKRIYAKKVAKEMLAMLEAVVDGSGTGRRARLNEYRVAGKTGTARILGEAGYSKHHHVATFVGIAPVTHPKLVVAVVISDPSQGRYYGSQVAAPIFKEIMAGALKMLQVPPDKRVS